MSTQNTINFEYDPELAIGSKFINSVGSFIITNGLNIGYAVIFIGIVFNALTALRQPSDKSGYFFKKSAGLIIIGVILTISVNPALRNLLSSIWSQFGAIFGNFKF